MIYAHRTEICLFPDPGPVRKQGAQETFVTPSLAAQAKIGGAGAETFPCDGSATVMQA